jgi:hypothetical protein
MTTGKMESVHVQVSSRSIFASIKLVYQCVLSM